MVTGLNIYAIGRIATQLRITAQLVAKLANELGIEPAITINDVAHYTRGDVTVMRARIAGEAAATELESPSEQGND